MNRMSKIDITALYRCLADPLRLRILHLLYGGTLCVCHLQEILDEKQVTVSKQLQYLRQRELVEAHRQGKWMHYALRAPVHAVLQANLAQLNQPDEEYAVFQEDVRRRIAIERRLQAAQPDC